MKEEEKGEMEDRILISNLWVSRGCYMSSFDRTTKAKGV